MQIDYHSCYKTLQLESDANLQAAQMAYRRLVHEWHPDRHNESKLDNKRAQEHFIELTSSYNAIRKYHRKFKRMPLAPIKTHANATRNHYTPSDSLLKREKKQEANQFKARNRVVLWGLGAGCCIAVLILLFEFDKRVNAKAGAEAHRELETVAPSRYERTQDEVNRGQKAGTFVTHQPVGGKLIGDSKGSLIPR